MKSKGVFVLSVAGIFVILLALNSGLGFAEELKGTVKGSLNALDSGYAVTRWPWDSGDIFPGDSVQVRACTTEPPYPNTTWVVFRWNRPDGSQWDTPPKVLTKSVDTWDGLPIWDAYDHQTLHMMGNWGVQALFCDENGKLQGPNPYPIVNIKAISYHVVPEVPLGTIAILTAMFGATAIFALKRKRVSPLPI